MNKIRVLHFKLDSHLGGIEMFLANLMSEIDQNRFQFEFVTSVEHPALENKFLDMGGIIHHVPAIKFVQKYKKAIQSLLEDDYDVVHFHKNSAANIIPIEEAKKAGKKIIVHSHNTLPSVGKITYYLHMINKRKLNELVDYKLACSSDAGIWMFNDSNYEIATNGIRTKKFKFDLAKRAKIREELGIQDNVFVCGNVGRFSKQKNHKRLITIFEKIKKIKKNSILLLVGDGDLKGEIVQEIKKFKLDSDVIFTGIRSDISELLMAMDVFIMPSLYEGLPIVAIEAQASGLQLFLSDSVSKETKIINQVTWFSLSADNFEIADKICQKASANNNRSLMYKEVANAGYDITHTMERLSDLYINIGKLK